MGCEFCGKNVDKVYICSSCGLVFCKDCGYPEKKLCRECEVELSEEREI